MQAGPGPTHGQAPRALSVVDAADVADDGPGWVPGRPAGSPVEPGPEVSGGCGELTSQASELRRRAFASALTAYSAAHGHPLDHATVDNGPTRVRWATRGRVALASALVLAAVTGFVVVRALDQVPSAVVRTEPDGTGITAAGEVTAAGPPGVATEPGGPTANGEGEVVVHVVGQVARPGVVTLPGGSRVADAIEAVGGAGPEADLAAVNLARVLADGEQVLVPRSGEPAPALPGQTAVQGGPIDLNGADVAALDALPGIGPVLAQRIVDWRTDNGRFTSVEELGEVTGIGPAVLAGLRDLVRA